MNAIALIAGLVILFATLADVIWTAMWVGGSAGPLTRTLGNLGWRASMAVSGRHHRPKELTGPAILTATVLIWLALLWTGWYLIFSADPAAVRNTQSGAVADASDRLYFVGYTLFTLGIGDFSPSGGGWQVATVLATATGLFTATLSITYLLAVISAAVSARAFAIEVAGLGGSPAEAVAAGWDGTSCASLAFALQSLSGKLSNLSQQYLAYPVFQYFHSGDPATSPIVALARLEQILLVSAHAVPAPCRAPHVLHNMVGSAIDTVLASLPQSFVAPHEEGLPVPDLEPLRRAGLPGVSEAELVRAAAERSERRRRLRGLLSAHGWGVEHL